MAKLDTLEALFEQELRDLYDAERQIIKALPKMIEAAENEELRTAFEGHLEETREHVNRLESVFEEMDLRARGKHCPGMAGIIEEGRELIGEEPEARVLDVGLIASAQRVEHYEIAAYGTLVAWAETLGQRAVVPMLQATLDEEKATDEKLTTLARTAVNEFAKKDDRDQKEPSTRSRARAAGRR